MLRFTLFGFPVAIHWTFWLVAALMGGATANSVEGFRIMLVFVVVAVVSILLHELGHASFQRKFGGSSRIVLHAFGGLAIGTGRFTHKQGLIITCAGPAVTLALSGGFYLLARMVTGVPPNLLGAFIYYMIVLNLFWGVLNLVPVLPLDGGRILEHLMGGRNARLRFRIAAVCAVAVALVGIFWWKTFVLAALFGYLAYVNWQASEGREVSSPFGP